MNQLPAGRAVSVTVPLCTTEEQVQRIDALSMRSPASILARTGLEPVRHRGSGNSGDWDCLDTGKARREWRHPLTSTPTWPGFVRTVADSHSRPPFILKSFNSRAR